MSVPWNPAFQPQAPSEAQRLEIVLHGNVFVLKTWRALLERVATEGERINSFELIAVVVGPNPDYAGQDFSAEDVWGQVFSPLKVFNCRKTFRSGLFLKHSIESFRKSFGGVVPEDFCFEVEQQSEATCAQGRPLTEAQQRKFLEEGFGVHAECTRSEPHTLEEALNLSKDASIESVRVDSPFSAFREPKPSKGLAETPRRQSYSVGSLPSIVPSVPPARSLPSNVLVRPQLLASDRQSLGASTVLSVSVDSRREQMAAWVRETRQKEDGCLIQ